MIRTRRHESDALQPFSEAAPERLRNLQGAFAEVLSALGSDLTATELANRLGIDIKLAWRVVRLCRAGSPIAAAEHLPGEEGVDIFLQAAKKKGVKPTPIERVLKSSTLYRELEDLYAGDRLTLESMLAALGPMSDDHRRLLLQQRRDLFNASSRSWGLRCRVQYCTSIVAPTRVKSMPGYEDFATLRGYVDLVRLRDEVSWSIPRARITDERRTTSVGQWQPLDAAANARHGAPVIPGMCSANALKLKELPTPAGPYDRVLVADWPVGVRTPMSICTGEWCEAAAKSWTDDPSFKGEMYVRVYTPSESLVLDHLVHRSLFGRLAPTLHVLSDLGPFAPYPQQADLRTAYAVPERVDFIGEGAGSAVLAEVPGYRELLLEACAARGWSPEDFDVYRVRMAYPPLSSIVSIRYPIPVEG